MMRVRKILIPLDTSALSRQVLSAVRALFAPGETELTLLSVLPLGDAPASASALPASTSTTESTSFDQEEGERQFRLAEAELQSIAQQLQAAGYQASALVRGGDPVQEIVTCLETGDYDLVAMATHGRTGSDRLLMGSVAERVMRRVRMPLLLLRPFAQPATETILREQSLHTQVAGRVMTLATATDGSTHAQVARVLANGLASAFHAELKVIVVADEHDGAASAQHLMQDVQKRLGDFAQPVELIPLVGRTDIVLERYLSEHPVDLLVIGGFKDRDAGASAHIGLTAQQVVRHIPMSVLVAKGYTPKLRRLLAFVASNDEAVIEVAAQWASALNADLRLLHVMPPVERQPEPVSPRLADMPLNEILARGLFRQEKSSLADEITTVPLEAALADETPVARFLQATLFRMDAEGLEPSALLLRRGPTVRTVLYIADQEKADLIIVGSQSEPGFFLDSVASDVVQLATCSVLVVRTKRG
jgi:nucleotide-binding universal stress UspA family protein